MSVEDDRLRRARADRLKQARRLRYETAVDAAKAMRLPVQTYLSHENATNGYTRSVHRYARQFRVHVAWLLAGEGPMKIGDPDPIAALVEQIPPERRAAALRVLQAFVDED